MITNLLAGIIVSIVTNSVDNVTGYETHIPDPAGCNNPGCLVMHWKGMNPNQITTTTTCERRTVMQFEWMGAVRKVEHVEVLWQSNVVKKLEWVIKP